MILQERNEGRRRQLAARFPAVCDVILGVFALIGESFSQTAAQVSHRIWGVVGVVSVGFPGEQHVNAVVDIVVPLRVIQSNAARLIATQVARGVVDILDDEVDKPFRTKAFTHGLCKFGEDVRLGLVNDGVNRIETQAVEVIFLKPVPISGLRAL